MKVLTDFVLLLHTHIIHTLFHACLSVCLKAACSIWPVCVNSAEGFKSTAVASAANAFIHSPSRCYAPLAALLSLVFVLLLDDLRLRVRKQRSIRGKRWKTGTEGDMRRTNQAVVRPLHDKVCKRLFHFVRKLVSQAWMFNGLATVWASVHLYLLLNRADSRLFLSVFEQWSLWRFSVKSEPVSTSTLKKNFESLRSVSLGNLQPFISAEHTPSQCWVWAVGWFKRRVYFWRRVQFVMFLI